jgi:hypothetical protein
MDSLSKEQLIQLLTMSKAPPLPEKKTRKKADLDADKKEAMLIRLATMRETVKQNREAKKSKDTEILGKTEPSPATEKVFEDKYKTQLEKMNDLLTNLNENTKAVADIKKEKKAQKDKEKADAEAEKERLRVEREEKLKQQQSLPPPQPQPQAPPQQFIQQQPPPQIQAPLKPILPNRNMIAKNRLQMY